MVNVCECGYELLASTADFPYPCPMETKDCRYIHGVGISGYRSFGETVQRIGPFAKINLFVGQNNSGKSNILRFLKELYPGLYQLAYSNTQFVIPTESRSKHGGDGSANCEVGINAGSGFDTRLGEHIDTMYSNGNIFSLDKAMHVLNTELYPVLRGVRWFPVSSIRSPWGAWPDNERRRIQNKVEHTDTGQLWRALFGRPSDVEPGKIERLLLQIGSLVLPEIHIIDHTRRWGSASFNEAASDGSDLVHRLANLQRADRTTDTQSPRKWAALLDFFKQITGQPDADITIPGTNANVNIFLNGRWSNIDDLGTGIHEIVILAALCVIRSKSAICIEEPELHQHPRLQRKLLHFLDQHTDNQYFISTHSAHLLEQPGAAVFHVRLTEKGTVVEQAINPHEKSNVCADLGFRASDLLQSNCVIWVEGPSDRIYLREWLRLADSSIVEGVHYTIMFYGGKLLSHVTSDDSNEADVGKFISLRHLNRNLVVIMDSDRKSKGAKANATKRRILEEFEKAEAEGGGGFAWITDGREIENYVPIDAFNEALTEVGETRKVSADKFEDYPEKGDKVAIAKWLVENQKLSLDVLELRKRIAALVDFIQKSNEPSNPSRA